MSHQAQWRNLARAYYEKYAESLRRADWYVETFDELEEAEVIAIVEALEYAFELHIQAVLA